MNQDKTIEEFAETREDKDELKILRQRPAMLGDLIRFAIIRNAIFGEGVA